MPQLIQTLDGAVASVISSENAAATPNKEKRGMAMT
jgi:hypothetical protein